MSADLISGNRLRDGRAFSLGLLESRSQILRLISRGAPLRKVLRVLVLAIEELSGDMLGSVLLTSADGSHARHGAAPHLPLAYWRAIDGLKIGPKAGSCGTAMYRRRPVIVPDIATSPLWSDYRELALRNGLRACWSVPILSPLGDVLGAFALYYREPRQPGLRERQLVQVAAELSAIAIGRARLQGHNLSAARARRDLSPRELQVASFIAHGHPIKRIASRLGVSASTVYTHRGHIFRKLGVDSNVALTRYAMTHRLAHGRPVGAASEILR